MRKNPEKNLTQETCPDRGSNPGPLRDKHACYHFLHSGGPVPGKKCNYISPFFNAEIGAFLIVVKFIYLKLRSLIDKILKYYNA